MAQRPDANPAPANPVASRPLRYPNGTIDVLTLREWIKYEIQESGRGITYKNFSDKVCQFDARRLTKWVKGSTEECGASQFQMYDWCQLSAEEQMEVLKGNEPTVGYFQKPSKNKDFQKNPPQPPAKRNFRNEDGTIDVGTLTKELDYRLKLNSWPRTQFALCVVGGAATGAQIARLIDNPPPYDDPIYHDYYEKIIEWISGGTWSDDNRRRAHMEEMHLISVRKRQRPVSEEPQLLFSEAIAEHKKFLVDPSIEKTEDERFKQCMLKIVDREREKLSDALKQERPDDAVYDELDQDPSVVFLHIDYLYRLLKGEQVDEVDEKTKLERFISLGFMNGAKTDLDSLIRCLVSVLPSEQEKQTFAKNVLKCDDSRLYNILKTPQVYREDLDARKKFKQMREYLLKNREDRQKAMEG